MTRSTSFFDQLALQNTPLNEYAHAGRKAGKQALSAGPPDGPEYRRICSLPTRDWRMAYDVPALIDRYTRLTRLPGSSQDSRLLPMQAVALHELHEFDRLFVVAGLGTGKTLLSALAPTLVGCTPTDTLFLPPKSLVEKTRRDFRILRDDGWLVCMPENIVSAESFSTRGNAGLLASLRPRCIVIDEAHEFANPRSGRSLRLEEYLSTAEQRVYVFPLTGTPGDSTIDSIRHLLCWSVGDACPLPLDSREYWLWRQVTDFDPGYDPSTHRKRSRPPPGILSSFPGEDVREALGRRIESTPGVFYYRCNDVQSSLCIDSLDYRQHSPLLRDEFACVRRSDELSDGRVVDIPVTDSVLFATLGLGLARVINPPPPDQWLTARREYRSLTREILRAGHPGLHTPEQVSALFESGQLSHPAWDRWQANAPTFQPQRQNIWLDDGPLEFIAGRATGRQLIWCAFPEFARRLSALTGLPYFHSQGLSASGACIDNYRPGVDGPETAIVSIAANATGRNLQAWSQNLVIGCPGTADLLSQLIGRTHRRGQRESTVNVTIVMASIENPLALYRAREHAQVDRTLGRAVENRLLDCGWLVPSLRDYHLAGDPVWSLH